MDEITKAFQFFDKHRKLPTDKKRVNIMLSYESIIKISKIKNRSAYIDNLIKTV